MHGDYLLVNEIFGLVTGADAGLAGEPAALALPVLETPRLRLVPLADDDLPALFAIYADERVIRHFGQDPMTDLAQTRFWLAVQRHLQAAGLGVAWGLRRRADDALIGTLAFDGLNRQWHNVGISYGLAAEHWGQGYAREALQAALGHAFAGGLGCPIHRIQALVFGDNVRSRRLLQRLGFRHEGRRLGLLYWRERYWDLESYSLLQPTAG